MFTHLLLLLFIDSFDIIPSIQVYQTHFKSVRGERCENCHQIYEKDKSVKCQNCQYTSYCGLECAKNDTKEHVESGECDLILKHGNPTNDTVRFLLRFLLKLRINKLDVQPSIVDLVPNIEELRSFR